MEHRTHLNATIWKMDASYYCMMCQSNAMTSRLVDAANDGDGEDDNTDNGVIWFQSINAINQSERANIVNKISDRHLFTLQKAHILPGAAYWNEAAETPTWTWTQKINKWLNEKL